MVKRKRFEVMGKTTKRRKVTGEYRNKGAKESRRPSKTGYEISRKIFFDGFYRVYLLVALNWSCFLSSLLTHCTLRGPRHHPQILHFVGTLS